MFAPADANELYEALHTVCTTGQAKKLYEYHLPEHITDHVPPREYYLNLSLLPMPAAHGGLGHVILIGSDVTQEIGARKQIERLLSEQNAFLDIVAHELRTPLTAIRAATQYTQRLLARIQRVALPKEAIQPHQKIGKYLEETLHQTDFQNRLILDLLDAARIRAARLEICLRPCDLSEPVSRCVETHRRLHPERRIDLTLPIEETIMVMADAQRLEQVIVNFLTNALKYSESSEPVEVNVICETTHARICV